MDIYVSRLEDGKFGAPQNMGPCVNSVAPDFHPTVLWDRNEIYFVRVGATTDFFTAPLQLPCASKRPASAGREYPVGL